MPDLHDRLIADHRRLEVMFAAFSAGAASGDAQAWRVLAADFESTLLAHFEGEEKFLFPLLAREFPEEVTALRQEHELVRRQLGALVDKALDEFEPAVAERLVESLRRHARREDAMLYEIVNDSAASARYRDLITFLEETYVRLRAFEEEA